MLVFSPVLGFSIAQLLQLIPIPSDRYFCLFVWFCWFFSHYFQCIHLGFLMSISCRMVVNKSLGWYWQREQLA